MFTKNSIVIISNSLYNQPVKGSPNFDAEGLRTGKKDKSLRNEVKRRPPLAYSAVIIRYKCNELSFRARHTKHLNLRYWESSKTERILHGLAATCRGVKQFRLPEKNVHDTVQVTSFWRLISHVNKQDFMNAKGLSVTQVG